MEDKFRLFKLGFAFILVGALCAMPAYFLYWLLLGFMTEFGFEPGNSYQDTLILREIIAGAIGFVIWAYLYGKSIQDNLLDLNIIKKHGVPDNRDI